MGLHVCHDDNGAMASSSSSLGLRLLFVFSFSAALASKRLQLTKISPNIITGMDIIACSRRTEPAAEHTYRFHSCFVHARCAKPNQTAAEGRVEVRCSTMATRTPYRYFIIFNFLSALSTVPYAILWVRVWRCHKNHKQSNRIDKINVVHRKCRLFVCLISFKEKWVVHMFVPECRRSTVDYCAVGREYRIAYLHHSEPTSQYLIINVCTNYWIRISFGGPIRHLVDWITGEGTSTARGEINATLKKDINYCQELSQR